MKRLLVINLIGLLFSFSTQADVDNHEINFEALKGKVVYIDFWASWCGPCRASFPWMNEMHQKYADQGLEIIAVNLDQETDLANQFINELKPLFTIKFNPEGNIAEQFNVDTMPTSFLIDREGKARSRHKGFHDGKRDKYEQELINLLGE